MDRKNRDERIKSSTYIPPAKRSKQEFLEPGSEQYQRKAWDENKKKITGLINRANSSNIKIIIRELFSTNLIRYKGLLASALIKAQGASPSFTDVYAALLAVLNSRIKVLGKLVIDRLVVQYRLAFMNDDKQKCMAAVSFIAHLTNQEVVQEILALEILHHLLEKPTNFSVEIAITMLKECGAKLDDLTSRGLFSVFESLRRLTMEDTLDSRTHDLIEFIHTIKKDKFRDHPSIRPELDLIDENNKFTHEIELTGPTKDDFHIEFNHFKYDSNWNETEAKYNSFKQVILDEEESDESDSIDSHEDQVVPVSEESNTTSTVKQDLTGNALVKFRTKIYLTFRSSISHEEVVHKLLKMNIDADMQMDLCLMILDCCAQERAYIKLYGLVASLLCDMYPRTYSPIFEEILTKYYEKIYLVEDTNKLRNTAAFFAHMLVSNAFNWNALNCIKLREDETSSPGRCFVVFLFKELVSTLSISRLLKHIKDPAKSRAFENIFPTDNEQDTRFAINFFTMSELGSLTDDLRNHLAAINQTTIQ